MVLSKNAQCVIPEMTYLSYANKEEALRAAESINNHIDAMTDYYSEMIGEQRDVTKTRIVVTQDGEGSRYTLSKKTYLLAPVKLKTAKRIKLEVGGLYIVRTKRGERKLYLSFNENNTLYFVKYKQDVGVNWSDTGKGIIYEYKDIVRKVRHGKV